MFTHIKKIIIFMAILFIYCQNKGFASINNNMEYSKNYLYILVHGVGDNYKCFDNVYEYMRKSTSAGGMGLEGYVYRYQFSAQFGDIMIQAREFGDREYKDRPHRSVDRDSSKEPVEDVYETTSYKSFNQSENNLGNYWKLTLRGDQSVNSWLEQARGDFKAWYAYKNNISNPQNVSDSVVPQKFIIIAHSMGGLSVRAYMYGKDSSGRRFYQNDIEKVVYIDVPHLGSGAGGAAIWANENSAYRWSVPIAFVAIGNTYGFWGTPVEKKVLSVCTAYSFASTAAADFAFSYMNRYKSDALSDMRQGSSFLNGINSALLGDGNNPIMQKIIVGRGVPTAKNASDFESWFFDLVVYARIAASTLNAITESDLETWEEKMSSIYLTSLSGYPFFEDGDLVVSRSSQKGEGIDNLANSQIFEHLMHCAAFNVAMTAADVQLVYSFFIPPPGDFWLTVSTVLPITFAFLDNKEAGEYLLAHNTMKEKVVIQDDPNLLEQALYEQSVGASSTTHAVHSYSLSMSSNITKEANGTVTTLSTYHTVSPEAITETTVSTSVLPTPVVIDGKEKQIASFTVKEPPTRIEGVLRDFMPLKMQYFQYSENFAAWKNITVLNEWGHFRIDNLKLAEGQNMIAFRAKNKVGYESNQHLKIILNTIPMVISEMSPLPNTYTKINLPEIKGQFAKSVYVTNTTPGQGMPDISSAWLYKNGQPYMEILKDPNFKVQYVKENDYKTVVKFSWTPNQSLEDGEYQVVVSAKSEVGTSQGAWTFWVDTKAPTIMFTMK